MEFHTNEEGKAPIIEEQHELQTNVKKELKRLSEFLIRAVDVSHQINTGDRIAMADVVMDNGDILLKDVTALTLLELQKTLVTWRDVLATIPTLDPAKGFTVDTSQGEGVWKSRVITRPKTAKKNTPIELVKATDKFPAHAQLVVEDVPIGTVITQEWSTMITPSDKADLLSKCEELIRAVKKAKSKANNIDVDTSSANRIGDVLWNYIAK